MTTSSAFGGDGQEYNIDYIRKPGDVHYTVKGCQGVGRPGGRRHLGKALQKPAAAE